MRALGPTEAFRESLRLFGRRPFATLALGLALLTSLLAVCCGLGVIAAPWFLCELFALQIALGCGVRPLRTRAWLWAGFVQMLAVLLLCAVCALTLLSVGPDVVLGGSGGSALAPGVLRSVLVWMVAGGLTLLLAVYFEHAPALLLDRGGSLTWALLESARIVSDTGVVRTWFTSGIAHFLQLGPIVIGVAAAASFGTLSSTLLWGVVLLPFAALSLALGQGMVVASYLGLRDAVLEPARIPAAAALSSRRVLLQTLLLLTVLSGPVAVSAALVRPAFPQLAAEPPGQALLTLDSRAAPVQRFIPDTALTVRLANGKVRVQASDGGGTGPIPLPSRDLREVRVSRAPKQAPLLARAGLGVSVFRLDVKLGDGRTFTTWIDEAGVRLDDSLGRRLSSLLPPWATIALLLCLVWTASWIALALPPQGRLRKQLSDRPPTAAPAPGVSLECALHKQALLAALSLFPAAVVSFAVGLWAALGEGTLSP